MFIPQRTTVLLDFAAEPVEKPDARFICVRLGIVSRHWKVNAFRSEPDWRQAWAWQVSDRVKLRHAIYP
jgi:hypothetical protein